MNKILKLVEELDTYINLSELENQKISNSTIGWQIEHSLLTLNGIINNLKIPNPKSFKKKYGLGKFLIFTFGHITRGKAKAPEVVKPKHFDKNTLAKHIQIAKENIKTLDTIPAVHFFEHPYFGHLRVEETKRFLYIHTLHHLKIMRDIIKSTK
jgi:hypothetical protein